MDRWQIDLEDDGPNAEWRDYVSSDFADCDGFDETCPEKIVDGVKYWWSNCPAFLGNASEPFDIDALGYVELPLPKRSVVRLFGDEIVVDRAKAHFA